MLRIILCLTAISWALLASHQNARAQESTWPAKVVRKLSSACEKAYLDDFERPGKREKKEASVYCACVFDQLQAVFSDYEALVIRADAENASFLELSEQSTAPCIEEAIAAAAPVMSDNEDAHSDGWNALERSSAIDACVLELPESSEDDARRYCECMIGKMETIYPSALELTRMIVNDKAKFYEVAMPHITACMKQLGNSEIYAADMSADSATSDESNGWSELLMNESIWGCVHAIGPGTPQDSAAAQAYCACAMKKVEAAYPNAIEYTKFVANDPAGFQQAIRPLIKGCLQLLIAPENEASGAKGGWPTGLRIAFMKDCRESVIEETGALSEDARAVCSCVLTKAEARYPETALKKGDEDSEEAIEFNKGFKELMKECLELD